METAPKRDVDHQRIYDNIESDITKLRMIISTAKTLNHVTSPESLTLQKAASNLIIELEAKILDGERAERIFAWRREADRKLREIEPNQPAE